MSEDDEREFRPSKGGHKEDQILDLIGDGPFSLPKCSPYVSLLHEEGYFLLGLEEEGSEKRIWVPLPYEAARVLIDLLQTVVDDHPAAHLDRMN